ncbi:cytochrome c biogenesis protein ResB [Actinomadura rudentiformis]|uniref:Cytochrome c biogenesis protein ResB n=1 Tax=Actinomadura rudentiformis TaxID=359158 RepID=A0A6H9Z6E2_9ACTN|nr:cytochrome c biogenesis protein ResB [Actinomadura rudentiformis]KAB2350740.1 cytochrome c biogenesis protein ResB [Actinomadura rudentiformis]
MNDTDSATEIEPGVAAPPERQAAEETPRPKGLGPIGWLRWFWRQLTTMRTALILLFLVALGAVPGSILPQRPQAPEKVDQYFTDHASLAPWLDRFSLFDVFGAPWFAAIYILLFVSLAGCVIPRAFKHYRAMRARPPAAPRNLMRLPQSESYETDAEPDEVLEEARKLLRGRRFRVDVADGADENGRGKSSVAAEKGYLGETGNLVFHLALLALLFALGLGSSFGYRGNVLLTEGNTFANSLSRYDQFMPGREFDSDDLPPFTMTLDDFRATYETQGAKRGQATDYLAKVRYRETPTSPEKSYDLKVNHPLKVGGAKVYLLNHGYSPVFTVRDAKGNVAFRDAVPFLQMENRNQTAEGVIKVPDAEPDQLAFYAILWPTAVATPDQKQIVSAFPAPLNPMITISSFKGDLGLDSGTPQSVYKLEGIGKTLQPLGRDGQKIMKPGETFTLPNGAGSVRFEGLREWASLSVNRDPGRMPALIAAILAIAGVVASFMVRRRRVWVRATAGEDGRTVVEVGGLTLGNPTSEFDDIVAALRGEQDKPGTDKSGDDNASTDQAAGDKASNDQAAASATESEE